MENNELTNEIIESKDECDSEKTVLACAIAITRKRRNFKLDLKFKVIATAKGEKISQRWPDRLELTNKRSLI